MKIFISRKIIKEVIDHTRKEFPFEACGILAGKDNEVRKVYSLPNVEKSETSYFASPKEQIKVFKEMREENLELVGIYHSHPSSPPLPSQRDIELAFYPEAIYLIVSLKSYKNPEVRAYSLKNGEIEKVEIVLKGD